MNSWLNSGQKSQKKSSKHREHAGPGIAKDKYDSCVKKVKRAGTADNAYAVCNKSLKKEGNEPSSGFKSKYWFWGMEVPTVASEKPVEGGGPDGEAEARKILNENPQISAATFFNTLRSRGIRFVDTKQQLKDQVQNEADSVSAVGKPVVRESDKTKKNGLTFKETVRFSLKENAASDDGIGPTKFQVVMLKEGLGNLKDAFFYTKEALASAVPLFEGKKMYADHPDALEEKTRPERSVRDIIGHFENVRVEESEDGQSQLVADACLIPDKPFEWSRALIRESVTFQEKFPDKEFVGLSINASGDAEEKDITEFMKETEISDSIIPKLQKYLELGNQTIRLVKSLSEATSCDLVTEPGAGGKILKMLEGVNNMKKKHEAENEEAKKVKQAEADGEAPAADGEGHDDAAQDEELIKKHLKKHGIEADEAGMKMAKEMHQAYKEMGESGEAACEAMAKSMKLAKHMAAKKEAEEGEAEAEEAAKVTDKGYEYTESEKQLRNEVIKLKGIVAKLSEANNKVNLDAHLNEALAKTKLPHRVTREFRESVGPLKSKEQIDSALKLFVTAYESARGGDALNVFSEKTEARAGGLSFSDCLK